MGILEFKIVREFLKKIKKKFGRGSKKLRKVAELKQVEQGQWTMDEFVQMFKQVARDSSYGERLLIEEFKRKMNSKIRRKLIKMEFSPKSIKQ